MFVFRGHTDFVNCVNFSHEGKFIVSGSDDLTIRVWNVEECAEVKKFVGHHQPIVSVNFSPDSKNIVCGSRESIIRIW